MSSPAQLSLLHQVLLVAAGGAFGSVARHLAAVFVLPAHVDGAVFATLLVNALGSLLLGLLSTWPELRPEASLLLGTGAMGGFTTYSTFNRQSLALMDAGRTGAAAGYLGGTMALCLACGVLGMFLGRSLRPGG